MCVIQAGILESSAEGFLIINFLVEDTEFVSFVCLTPYIYFRNPNGPITLPGSMPEWPQFTLTDGEFMELNSTMQSVITTPHKERIDQVLTNLFSARSNQIPLQTAAGKWKCWGYMKLWYYITLLLLMTLCYPCSEWPNTGVLTRPWNSAITNDMLDLTSRLTFITCH